MGPLLLLLVWPQAPYETPRPEAVAFLDVALIPMDAERIVPHQSVIVRDGTIMEIGPAGSVQPPDDAVRIEGSGRYLMPGLADMHVHLRNDDPYWRNNLFLYIANGVTAVRAMGGTPVLLNWRTWAGAGQMISPMLVIASPGMDGPGGQYAIMVYTAEQARLLVRDYWRAGYDFIKVFGNLTPPVYTAIAGAAQMYGLKFAGHVPAQVGLGAALAAGQYSIEHLQGLEGTVDEASLRGSVEEIRSAGVWNVPTLLVSITPRYAAPDLEARPVMQYVSPAMLAWFRETHGNAPKRDLSQRAANLRAVIKALHDGGAKMAVGTDAGVRYLVPGFSLHDELREMVESGLSPYEALRMATSRASELLDRQSVMGTIATGKRADLLLLDANPLEDIRNATPPAGVMANGHWFSAQRLADGLNEIAAMYAQPAAVSSLHTVSIHVDGIEIYNALFQLLSGSFQWPLLYGSPLAAEQADRRNYAAVWAGNVRLELCGPYPAEFGAKEARARLHGLTFRPHGTAERSAAELDRRAIRHKPVATWGTRDSPHHFVTFDDADMISPAFSISVMEKVNTTREDPEHVRAGQKLRENRGGPLGLKRVREVRITHPSGAPLQKWQRLLGIDSPWWPGAGGAALRFIEAEKNGIDTLVLEVESAERCARALAEFGLPVVVVKDGVECDAHGVRLRFTE